MKQGTRTEVKRNGKNRGREKKERFRWSRGSSPPYPSHRRAPHSTPRFRNETRPRRVYLERSHGSRTVDSTMARRATFLEGFPRIYRWNCSNFQGIVGTRGVGFLSGIYFGKSCRKAPLASAILPFRIFALIELRNIVFCIVRRNGKVIVSTASKWVG